MTKHTKTNNLKYLIDPAFRKVNRLFALSFKNKHDSIYFWKYYTASIKIKDFNVLRDDK